jgi:hypothetical protein
LLTAGNRIKGLSCLGVVLPCLSFALAWFILSCLVVTSLLVLFCLVCSLTPLPFTSPCTKKRGRHTCEDCNVWPASGMIIQI